MNTGKRYSSKLLLFGEYGVLCGGEALAVPYPVYSASWIMSSNGTSICKKYLREFLTYLENSSAFHFLDINRFRSDLANGLDMESDVPVGAGLGSSGVMVAAVYDRYALHKEEDVHTLKTLFAAMEDCFHRKSSGLDPLVVFRNAALLMEGHGRIKILDDIPSPKHIRVGLRDTGIPRATHALVAQFHEKMRDPSFRKEIHETYLPLTARCIAAYLQDAAEEFRDALHALSAFQLASFEFAIPENIRQPWKDALAGKNELFKLCGAGGGGFMLQFTMEGNTYAQ